ncbi:DUF7534 family protein [Halegenticoccus soli]|uniref:DUF7534 family protein n=1 Tax=Halegenticoccus soli TaxID=1985678 RepID=UPI000C6CB8E1|nr:hypothetical protein [Halegenticoccus soli]
MLRRRLPTYVLTLLALDAVVLTVEAMLLPPDPFTQLVVLLPTLAVVPVVAYWLVYRGGFERLGVGVVGDDRDDRE